MCYTQIVNGKSLYEFYEKFLLLQFDIKDKQISWGHSDRLGPDENAHYFQFEGESYVLIFEDYGGLALKKAFIEETINLQGKRFEYVPPISETDQSISYMVKFPTPYQYCENVTGAFTLIKLQ